MTYLQYGQSRNILDNVSEVARKQIIRVPLSKFLTYVIIFHFLILFLSLPLILL